MADPARVIAGAQTKSLRDLKPEEAQRVWDEYNKMTAQKTKARDRAKDSNARRRVEIQLYLVKAKAQGITVTEEEIDKAMKARKK